MLNRLFYRPALDFRKTGDDMKIELIVDHNCFSVEDLTQVKDVLSQKLDCCSIITTPYSSDPTRFKSLGIHVLPAWLVDGEVLKTDPYDQKSLLETIRRKTGKLDVDGFRLCHHPDVE